MMVVPASSISQFLLISPSSPLSLRVVSRHRRVVNLEDERGRLLALAHPQVGNGPFHIVLASDIAFDGLEPGVPGRWDDAALTVGNLRVDVRLAEVWDPFLARSPGPIPAASWELARECAQLILAASPLRGEIDAPAWDRLQEGVAALKAGWRQGDAAKMREAAGLLAGLGPGLTPAGDDVLLGFMARGWMQDSASSNRDSVFSGLGAVWREKGRTTRISREWLDHAAAGRFAEPWHELHAALRLVDDEVICRAMDRIAGIGATSGRLALLGAFSMP